VSSDKNQMIFIGDLIYDPKEIADPNWYSIFDFDPVQVVATRQRVLAQAARERTLLMAYHVPFPGLGYVTQQGVKYPFIDDKCLRRNRQQKQPVAS
jgi:glyoxylase-like metal-dependent hydrolase (beta-lactamase superfamily II)